MRSIVLCILFVLASFTGQAQDAEWPVTERCVGDFTYPSVPPSRWDFDGIIVSVNDEGVRAIQAAAPQQYFIALSSEETYPETGAFSPDGRWFAYFTGQLSRSSMLSTLYVTLNELVIISTDGGGEPLRAAWHDYFSPASTSTIPQPVWLNSLVVTARKYDTGQWYALDRTEALTFTAIDTPEIDTNATQSAFSPDRRYTTYMQTGSSGRPTLHYADLAEQRVYDLCVELPHTLDIQRPTAVWSPDSTTLAFTVDGFPVLLNVETLENTVLRYATGEIMAWLPPLPTFKAGRG